MTGTSIHNSGLDPSHSQLDPSSIAGPVCERLAPSLYPKSAGPVCVTIDPSYPESAGVKLDPELAGPVSTSVTILRLLYANLLMRGRDSKASSVIGRSPIMAFNMLS